MGGRVRGARADLRRLPGLCLITDRKSSGRTAEEMVRIALGAGARWIQYREKETTRRERYLEALKIRDLTRQVGALFIINDETDIALAAEADGVHLGQDDLPLPEARKIMGERIIGISTHSLSDAIAAQEGGADYIGFGPMFPTATKDAGTPKGVAMLREIRSGVQIPVVAIGGISTENLQEVFAAGADAVAVASAILRGDIAENVRSFVRAIGAKQ
jgi:thiamine-phosphate pyrophosphorylase